MNWHIQARRYLETLGDAEYAAFLATRKRKGDRYNPTDYHRDLIDFLNSDDEEGFKALKLQRHAYSALGTGEAT